MSRFHQRVRVALRNPEVRAGYQAMEAQRTLQAALEAIRAQQGLTKELIADRMDCHRESVSRVLTASDANPTLETLISLFQALGTTADITFRPAKAGDSPIMAHIMPHASVLTGDQVRRPSVPAPAHAGINSSPPTKRSESVVRRKDPATENASTEART